MRWDPIKHGAELRAAAQEDLTFPAGAEITGMGDEYEAGTRSMIVAGVKWLRENPGEVPQFRRFRDMFELLASTNPAAEKLRLAMIAATPKEWGAPSGAALGCAVLHALYAHRNGWGTYCLRLVSGRRAEA